MDIIRSEGIVLHSFPYREYDQILTVFTKDFGVVKLIVKGARSTRRGLHATLAPLSCAEFLFRMGKKELHSCRDVSIVNLHLHLRESIHLLNSACALLRAIHRTQQPEHPSPNLYTLLLKYLDHIETTRNLDTFVSSFLLKLLKHEGLLHLKDSCSVCNKPLEERMIIGGESFCPTHAPLHLVALTSNEANLLNYLIHSRSLVELEAIALSETVHRHISILFDSLIRE